MFTLKNENKDQRVENFEFQLLNYFYPDIFNAHMQTHFKYGIIMESVFQ